MAFAVADRVKETSTTTGTGTLNLGGAEPGYQTFVAGVGTGNTTYYAIVNRATSEFEVGVGTVTDAAPDTLSRDTIISSSNGGSAVNFSAGTKDVICTLPSEKSYVLDNAGDTTISADLSVTSISGSGAGLTALNASNVSSGTLPDARFPATLPTASGANLTNLNASNVSSGTLDDARLTANVTLNNASTISAGTLADARLTANVTLNNASTISAGTLADARLTANVTLNNASTISTGTLPNARLSAIPNSALDNSSITINGTGVSLGGSINVGDIEGVTAGSGLTGGGTTGTVTLNVGAGTGIDVSADAVAVDVSDFMTNGVNNRVLTATGADAMNAESGLTYDGSTLDVTGDLMLDTTDATLRIKAGTTGTEGKLAFTFNTDITEYGILALPYDTRATTGLLLQSDNYPVTIDGQTGINLDFNGSTKCAVTATGISVTGTVVESSSLAYKENVQPLEFNEAIYNVNAVKYDRKDGSSKDEVGVIAEELYKVLPDLVTTKDGKPEAVKYTKMTMYLLEALKKQNQEIQELKSKFN